MNNQREILFRGFHPCEDGDTTIYVEGEAVKGRWVGGWYQQITCGYNGAHGNATQIVTFKKLDNGEIVITGILDVIPFTVGQYTGKSDTKGNKVFIGSLFYDSDYEETFSVDWSENYLAVMAIYQFGDEEHLSDMWNDSCEVIGTIWDKENEHER